MKILSENCTVQFSTAFLCFVLNLSFREADGIFYLGYSPCILSGESIFALVSCEIVGKGSWVECLNSIGDKLQIFMHAYYCVTVKVVVVSLRPELGVFYIRLVFYWWMPSFIRHTTSMCNMVTLAGMLQDTGNIRKVA